MDKRVLGNIGITSLFAAMLLAGLVEGDIPIKPATAVLSDVHTAAAAEANEQLAFSTMFPAFVPNKLPVPDMVDIAIEAGLGEAMPLEIPDDDTEKSETQAEDSVKAPDVAEPEPEVTHVASTKNELPASMDSFTAVRLQGIQSAGSRFLSKVSAFSSLQSREFNPLLRPDGFYRPHWQDLSFDADLDNPADKVKPFMVVLDPGHGGSDPGSKGHNGLLEKDLTLDIARRVRLFLTEIDEIDVQLTRNHDYGLSRQSRVDSIRRSEADMVISLHFNHLPQTEINLVESFYAGPENIHESRASQRQTQPAELHRTAARNARDIFDLSFTEGSARLAKDLQQRVFTEVSFENDHAQNAGVKQETLFVLTQSYTPGVLLEISCLSHAQEADRLVSDDYRNRLAAALVDGIRNYYDSLQAEPLKKPGDLGV